MLLRRFAALVLLAVGPAAAAAEWKPAPAPLMTKWGKQVTPETAWQEYPRPQLVRKDWLNLNGLWDFAVTAPTGGPPPKWDGQILVPYPIESALSGVGKHVTNLEWLWYRRTFTVPAKWKGKRILLHFGAVDWEAAVQVNGKQYDPHRGGSDPFTLDITDALKEGENELLVRVFDPTDHGTQPRGKQVSKPEGIWYTPVTGIWQTVWMEPVAKAPWIKSVRFTPDVEKGEVEILVEAEGARQGVLLQWTEARPDKKTASHRGPANKPFRVKLDSPHLWTPDDPYLYRVTISVWNGGRALRDVDDAESYFAFRSVSVGKDEKGFQRILLNGKPLFQIGPLDQGWWPDGLLTPPSDAAMKYDLEVLKKLGFNMLRKHIKVEPARYYHHCDQLGLLVWQDMPSGGIPSKGHLIPPNAKDDANFTDVAKKQFRTELKAMIDHLRFFPCIVVWVPFNEGWGQHDTNDILKWVKEYDPSRLVNGPSGWADRGYGDLKDMHNYPGPGMFPAMPDRVSVLGEFGGLGLPMKGHLWKQTDNWGYRVFFSPEELGANYHLLMRRLHPLIGKGLSAAVYTQTTDVEVEVNGLMTYDREVIKLDPAEVSRWHKTLFGPPPVFKELIATSEKTGIPWRFTTAKPEAGWEKPEFDATTWKSGEAGFGTKGTPGTAVRTEWKTPDIWIRRTFDLADVPPGEILLRLHHDEDCEVYINGVLAAKLLDWTTEYGEVPMTPAARKTLKKGTNTIAIHCRQTTGGQYIDAGLVEVVK
jgi:hypothetical protein